MESAAYAGHLLVAETMARIMADRGTRQDAAFERLIAVLERMAPVPPPTNVPPFPAPTAPGTRSASPPGSRAATGFATGADYTNGRAHQVPASWFPPCPATTGPVLPPPGTAPTAPSHEFEMGTVRQLYTVQQIPAPIAMDSNGQ
ncbi:unnamed protein product [Closterium sp. NIES-54]